MSSSAHSPNRSGEWTWRTGMISSTIIRDSARKTAASSRTVSSTLSPASRSSFPSRPRTGSSGTTTSRRPWDSCTATNDLIDFALRGTYGFDWQLGSALPESGFWAEWSGYHFVALRGMIHLAEMARHNGIDLYHKEIAGRTMKKMFDAPLLLAQPNFEFPRSKDSGGGSILEYAPYYEVGYAVYRDPKYLSIMKLQSPRPGIPTRGRDLRARPGAGTDHVVHSRSRSSPRYGAGDHRRERRPDRQWICGAAEQARTDLPVPRLRHHGRRARSPGPAADRVLCDGPELDRGPSERVIPESESPALVPAVDRAQHARRRSDLADMDERIREFLRHPAGIPGRIRRVHLGLSGSHPHTHHRPTTGTTSSTSSMQRPRRSICTIFRLHSFGTLTVRGVTLEPQPSDLFGTRPGIPGYDQLTAMSLGRTSTDWNAVFDDKGKTLSMTVLGEPGTEVLQAMTPPIGGFYKQMVKEQVPLPMVMSRRFVSETRFASLIHASAGSPQDLRFEKGKRAGEYVVQTGDTLDLMSYRRGSFCLLDDAERARGALRRSRDSMSGRSAMDPGCCCPSPPPSSTSSAAGAPRDLR